MKTDSLIINGQYFSEKELIARCNEKIGNSITPAWEKQVFEFILRWYSPSEYISQYSSGTTGKSRKLELAKSSMAGSAATTCRYFGLNPGNTALLCLPADYIAGKMMIVRSIIGKLDLYLAEPKSMPDLSTFPAIDFCAMVPLQVQNVWSEDSNPPAIQKLIIGGAELNSATEDLLKKSAVNAWMTYGMAETCSHIAVRRINGEKASPWYEALPGIELEVDDRQCLTIKASWLHEPVITNDRVQIIGKGRFLWLGRYDNLLNSGGIKISPEEIELELNRITGDDFALLGIPDEKFGHRLMLVAEKRSACSDESILEELSLLLPRQLLPKKIMRIRAFPRNRSFKIDRTRLLALITAQENLK